MQIYYVYTSYIPGISTAVSNQIFLQARQLVSVNAHTCLGDQEGFIPHATRATRPGGKAASKCSGRPPTPAASACATGRLLAFRRRHSLTRCCLSLGGVLVTTRATGVVLVVVVTRFVAAVAVTAVAVAVTGVAWASAASARRRRRQRGRGRRSRQILNQ